MDINEKMKRDWNRRAKVDSKYWVAATEEADESSYHASASKDVSDFMEGLSGQVQSDMHVLDLGCGVGRMTALLASHFERVVGVDVADEMIKDARNMHADVENLSFYVNDGSSLSDFPDDSFDLVLSYSVLPHLPMAVCESYFKEVNRILKPNGLFRYQFWVGDERRMDDTDTLNIRVYSETQFAALNELTGFSIDTRTAIEYHDPVLDLSPVWITCRRTDDAGSQSLFSLDLSKSKDDAEVDLEYGLLLYLAFKHLDRGETQDAERVFEDAVHLAPDRPDAYIQWATIRVEKDDVKGALAIFETLSARAPDFAPGWLFRAQLCEALDQIEDARMCVTQYETFAPIEELSEQCAELKARLNLS